MNEETETVGGGRVIDIDKHIDDNIFVKGRNGESYWVDANFFDLLEEREFGRLEQSEIFARDMRILDDDDLCDADAINMTNKIFI